MPRATRKKKQQKQPRGARPMHLPRGQEQRQQVVVNIGARGLTSSSKASTRRSASSYRPPSAPVYVGQQLLPPRLAEPDRARTSLLVEGFKMLDSRLSRLYDRVDESGDRLAASVRDADDRRRADSKFWLDTMMARMSGSEARREAAEAGEAFATGDPSLTKPGGSGRVEDLPERGVGDRRSEEELRKAWMRGYKISRAIEMGYADTRRVSDKAARDAFDAAFGGLGGDGRKAGIAAAVDTWVAEGLIATRVAPGPAASRAAAGPAAYRTPAREIHPSVYPTSGPFPLASPPIGTTMAMFDGSMAPLPTPGSDENEYRSAYTDDEDSEAYT